MLARDALAWTFCCGLLFLSFEVLDSADTARTWRCFTTGGINDAPLDMRDPGFNIISTDEQTISYIDADQYMARNPCTREEVAQGEEQVL